jgi:PAS domain S-box-containing protein
MEELRLHVGGGVTHTVRRHWREASLRSKVLAVASVPLLPLLAVTALVFAGAERERAAGDAVAHTLEVKAGIATLFALLAEVETGARGYALSPHPDTLQVVRDASSQLPKQFEQLLEAVADNEVQRASVRRLMRLDQERPIEALLNYAPGDGTPLEPIIAKSRSTMREIRTELANMVSHEDHLLARRMAAAHAEQRSARLISIGGFALALLGSVLAVVLLSQDMSRRLTRLAARAASLANGSPGSPHRGGDEIARVEQSLERASELLAERQELIATQMREVDAARAELSQFFDLSLDLLCIADFDGRFRKVNRAWQPVLGWDLDALVSQPFVDLVHPDDVERTIAETAALGRGADTVGFENRYRCRDGTYRWLSWKATADMEARLIYGAARDVTARRAIEEHLQRAQEEAQRANRAKSDFVSRMSHDMRTPLNAVLGFAQLLESDTLTPEQRESVELISRGGRHLLNLIDEVLDIARIEAGQLSLSPEPVQLHEVVHQAVELIVQLAATREVTVHVEPPERALVVTADRQRLNQLLLNLLSNAIKYNRRGGLVRINFSATTADRVRVIVSDTGFGIAPDKLARLFTPFERLGAEATGIEGTGLGLAVSRGLAAAMGGELGVTSEPGKGSSFWFELAVADAQPVREESSSAPVVGDRSDVAASVLYVEDNPSNVRLMQRILARRPGVSLHTAPSGRIGLELALTLCPDAIFLDLNLPDMHGRDVLRELRLDERLRHIPVAVLSADATPAQTRTLLSEGAAAYLTKPLDVAKVLATLAQLVAPAAGAAMALEGNTDA